MSDTLTISDLYVEAGPTAQAKVLVRGASLRVPAGSVVGLVGESGSGKTVTCMSALGLAGSGVRITGGSVRLAGTELVGADAATLNRVRGGVVGTVFQDPLSSLNPLQRVGAQIAEALVLHRGGRPRQHRARVVELLASVGVPGPEQRMRAYPHELSGGLRQRVAIAIALANDPALLVADEPTTALDVTVQAQVLDVIRKATRTEQRAALIVTHDFGLVAEVADRVAVMYAGQIVEEGPVQEIFTHPQHPYTRGLLASRPTLATGRRRLAAMPGRPPVPGQWPAGCAFAERCPHVVGACAQAPPITASTEGWSRCWRPGVGGALEEVR
ncbi:ABC transporter ATP-binding protein [Nocardioides sp. zg-536]|uniref:ABC transporter ATP-binding protein n=1 Tax=Nocardioides faecalis TaxID=2803858 RepID=A0A938Y889_9ACTN|nr:ABC transporter ATP-binding protein [Nocardioides faecalis]MBM9459049.1 ABC transporter ATP-binding protein [Nocardioides faecalis]QVI57314.1 ABC transporter ATP-binding protein [Nocardioides faecalis]